MRKTIYTIIAALICALPLYSCSTTYTLYSDNIYRGKQLLLDKEYRAAEKHFKEAMNNIRDAVSLTFLTVAEYKIGNLEGAGKLIEEAAKEKPDILYLVRTFGYRAIIFMNRDKAQGIAALKDYIDRYEHLYPLESIGELEGMVRKGDIDKERMEKIIEEQIGWYEKEMEQYLTTRTGFYARVDNSRDSQ
jgi:tetratricopeptide (TPR) repeat protein